MISDQLPSRVRVLVLGGGIHGIGVLHDMVSRGWKDVHLIEKSQLAAGTSSRSTKLIHGGLRYLQNIRDFYLVSEALKERQTLMNLVPDLVKPIELLLPVVKGSGRPWYVLKTGLFLYDTLAGRANINSHRAVTKEEATEKAPILDLDRVTKIYSFWDSQTDDLELVKRISASARHLGAGVTEGVGAKSIKPSDDGWVVTVQKADGSLAEISALYVVNALGPWANIFLESSGIVPTYRGLNNEGTHLLVKDLGLKAGLFLQANDGKRIFFVLPWNGYTLVGTTESKYEGHPDDLKIDPGSIRYLLDNCNKYLKNPILESDIHAEFTGLRWLAVDDNKDISSTSRSYQLGEMASNRGLLLTIYGGKLTTYRNLSETIGDRLTHHFGQFSPSKTGEKSFWVSTHLSTDYDATITRFRPGGKGYAEKIL